MSKSKRTSKQGSELHDVAPGVWRLRLGRPEKLTPLCFKEEPPNTTGLAALPAVKQPPFRASQLRFKRTVRGCVVEIPLGDGEQVYGFGLQLRSLNQTAKKRTLRVNSDPVADTGDSHAPVPFYVTTGGYGVYIDTARYALVNTGSHVKVGQGTPATGGAVPSGNVADVYGARKLKGRYVVVDIPTAAGVDLYFFAGPDVRAAVQRYNLFAGGGCLPPLWGLGVWYRAHTAMNSQAVLRLAEELRASQLPIDVFGLEPGWQEKTYSCSYTWSKERFPDPGAVLERLRTLGFEVNLWEHVFVHPTAPFYKRLQKSAADYEVWGGLIPDLTVPAARAAFAEYHDREFVARGVTGFKLDECDNSDMTPYFWSFPEAAQFPSGLDGEQMHSLLGVQYQRTLGGLFRRRNIRTLSQVRSSHAWAAPYPFVLYSDLYDHRDFVRGVLTAGFGGLLWSPEVRDSATPEELVRRIQSVVLSPHALINAWYITNPPWRQVNTAKNNRGELLPEADELTARVKRLFELRMQLLPYLYAACARYKFDGLPAWRALVMDYPQDAATHKLDDQWLIGENLLFAPIFIGQTEREVYLPAGDWYHFGTRTRHAGGQKHKFTVEPDSLLLFVKAGTILPLAKPVTSVRPDTVFDITATVFGAPARPCALFEDDGRTYDFERGAYNQVVLTWDAAGGNGKLQRVGAWRGERYRVTRWDVVP